MSNNCNKWNLPYEVDSWPRLLRIIVYVFRFLNNIRNAQNRTEEISLFAEEVSNARDYWIKSVQTEYYAQELKDLLNKGNAAAKSPLFKLNPFIDKDKII